MYAANDLNVEIMHAQQWHTNNIVRSLEFTLPQRLITYADKGKLHTTITTCVTLPTFYFLGLRMLLLPSTGICCGDFSETAPLQRSSTARLAMARKRAHAQYCQYHVKRSSVEFRELPPPNRVCGMNSWR